MDNSSKVQGSKLKVQGSKFTHLIILFFVTDQVFSINNSLKTGLIEKPED
jgi:hypothetical protein